MATIPKPIVPRSPRPPVGAAPVVREVVELEPERGYLSREVAELSTVAELTGEESVVVWDNGRAWKSPLRYIISLARQENTPVTAGGRIGGGGGRHTFERSVARAPEKYPEDTDKLLAVRDGQAIQLEIGAILATITAAEMLTLIKTVDGAGSGLDADLLDAQSSGYYTDIVARLGYTPADATRQIISGGGLSGGGNLTADRTLAVGAGTGITVNADDVALDTAHARNVDHSAVSITAGTGLSGGGTIAATRTLNVTGLTTAEFAANVVDTDVTLAANSNTRLASQAAVKAYADALIAANDAMVFKGVIDCSANPNYPAADRGHVYKVSVAGKIGGASGPNVEVGDQLLCITDSTAAGNHATVGANWSIIQTNLDGAVIGPASVTDDLPAIFDGATGKLIKSKTYAAFKTLLVLVKGDVGLGNVDNTSDATKNAAVAALTNKNLSSGTNTFPTFNQNTTGSAATLTTARTIDGQSFNGSANITVIAPGTHAASSKATPVDADEVPLVDSAASNVLKRLTWANLKATLISAVGAAKASFHANKNATSQTLIAVNTFTKVTMTTELYDYGAFYDAANSKWTPPAGRVTVKAAAYFSTATIGDLMLLTLYKNGSRYRDGGGFYCGATNLGYAALSCDDDANGTDFYELYCYCQGGAGTRTLDGAISASWFQGSFLGG